MLFQLVRKHNLCNPLPSWHYYFYRNFLLCR